MTIHDLFLYFPQHRKLAEEKDRDAREKERNLQKKVTDLNSQVNKLDKRISILKSENDTLVSYVPQSN